MGAVNHTRAVRATVMGPDASGRGCGSPRLQTVYSVHSAGRGRTGTCRGDYHSEMGVIIVIATSAGGLGPLTQIIAALPPTCRASVFVVQHIGANESILPDILARARPSPGSLRAARAR